MTKKKIYLKDFEHVAILQTAFLGDVAATFPLIESIREINHKCRISYITTPQAKPLVSCSSSINKIIEIDKSQKSNFSQIKKISNEINSLGVDCMIVPHRSMRSSLITYFSRVRAKVGFDLNSLNFIYNHKVHYNYFIHETQRNLSLLRPFIEFQESLFLKNFQFNLKFDRAYINYIREIISKNNLSPHNSICIAPGTVWATKRWLPEYFIELIRKFNKTGFKVVLIGSQSDSDICSQISENTDVLNLCGKTNIPQILLLLKNSRLLITNDSSPTHFAGISGTQVVTLFGPTSPIFGFSPWSLQDKVAEIKDMKCRPCRIHGSNSCPLKTHDCMRKLTPEAVYEICLKILK